MEVSKVEFSLVEAAHKVVEKSEIQTLTELQLALVGGGSGETIL